MGARSHRARQDEGESEDRLQGGPPGHDQRQAGYEVSSMPPPALARIFFRSEFLKRGPHVAGRAHVRCQVGSRLACSELDVWWWWCSELDADLGAIGFAPGAARACTGVDP